MYFTRASFPLELQTKSGKTSRMDSLTHAAVISALITHTVTIHGGTTQETKPAQDTQTPYVKIHCWQVQ